MQLKPASECRAGSDVHVLWPTCLWAQASGARSPSWNKWALGCEEIKQLAWSLSTVFSRYVYKSARAITPLILFLSTWLSDRAHLLEVTKGGVSIRFKLLVSIIWFETCFVETIYKREKWSIKDSLNSKCTKYFIFNLRFKYLTCNIYSFCTFNWGKFPFCLLVHSSVSAIPNAQTKCVVFPFWCFTLVLETGAFHVI